MTPQQIAIVQSQLATVKALDKPFAKQFYARLFQLAPDLRILFASGGSKDRKLIDTLCTTVNSLQNMDGLNVVAHNMGQRYSSLGVTELHYDFFIQAMLETLEMAIGDEFKDNVKIAWLNLMTTLKDTLLETSRNQNFERPAWGYEVPMALMGQ